VTDVAAKPKARKPTLRRLLHAQLNPRRRRSGLSPVNGAIVAIIVVSVACAVAQTEPAINRAYGPLFDIAELVFAIVFAVEYALRLWVVVEQAEYRHPVWGRLRWALTPMAIIDLLAWAPTLVLPGLAPSQILRVFRLIRILRLAKLGRMSRAWRLIGEAVAARRFELALVAGGGAFVLLAAATMLFATEAGAMPQEFGSIPRALWWEVRILTGLGRNGPYPASALGKLLAVLTAVTGIGLVAAPTGILAGAFSEAFHRHRNEPDSESDA
jgi:voltage-gated potassium channel